MFNWAVYRIANHRPRRRDSASWIALLVIRVCSLYAIARWATSPGDCVSAPRLPLTQSPELLLLDEPTNHLDPLARSELLTLVKRTEVAVIAVLHDLAAAEAFADRMLVIHHGKQVICDVPEAALHPSVSYPVFGMTSFRVAHPVSGKALRIFEVPHHA